MNKTTTPISTFYYSTICHFCKNADKTSHVIAMDMDAWWKLFPYGVKEQTCNVCHAKRQCWWFIRKRV